MAIQRAKDYPYGRLKVRRERRTYAGWPGRKLEMRWSAGEMKMSVCQKCDGKSNLNNQ